MSIDTNISNLHERIVNSARRVRRNPQEISLMAVTKTVSPDRIREAYEAGVRIFGENRVQEFAAKEGALRELTGAEWHMIGHLQSNKTGTAAQLFGFVESLDSIRLAEKLNAAAGKLGKTVSVLIEINIAGEQAKSGVAPDSPELERLLAAAPQFPALDFRGIMTVPPYNDNPERSRLYFRKMRALSEQIASRELPSIRMETLSMGMSHDFEVAIEEGSTCVRVGTAIFGSRPAKK